MATETRKIMKHLRTQIKRLSEAERREVINDIFGGETEYNRFYDAVSVMYRIFGFLFLSAAVLFTVIYVAMNSDSIRASQFEYLAHNFIYQLEQNSEERTYMTYSREDSMNFTVFTGGLAVCGDNELEIFSGTGIKTAGIRHGLNSPVAIGSDRYLLVYENGGKSYKLYSAFSEMHTGVADHKIYGAQIGANGSYLLITAGDDDARYVWFYNENFDLINKYTKYGNVLSAAVSDDGEHILILTLKPDSRGTYSVEVMLCRAGSTTAEYAFDIYGSLPLDSRFTDDGYIILCDDAVYFYGFDGKERTVYEYDGKLCLADISSDGAVIAQKDVRVNDHFGIVMFDSIGEIVYSDEFTGAPLSLSTSGGTAYLLTHDSVWCIRNYTDVTQREISDASSGAVLRAVNGHVVYLCTPSHAITLKFST